MKCNGTVTALAQHNPKKLYLAARSHSKAEAALERIRASSLAANSANIEILDLDLASFESVKAAAARVNNEVERLDLLQLNGGIGIKSFLVLFLSYLGHVSGVFTKTGSQLISYRRILIRRIVVTPPNTTQEGYELQFGANYLDHALLTQFLMPNLLKTAAEFDSDVRIVSVSSIVHRFFAAKEGIFFDQLKTDMKGHGGAELYAQAMLAKTLFAHELAKRYPQITSSSLHPGTVKSGVWGGDKDVSWLVANLIVKPVVEFTGVSKEEGARTRLWCSFGKDVTNGAYYEPVGKAGKEGKLTRNDELSVKLWDWTDKELRVHGFLGWMAS